MSWVGRTVLLGFMALVIASPAGVAECGGEFDPSPRPKPSPTVVPWTPVNCTTCHG